MEVKEFTLKYAAISSVIDEMVVGDVVALLAYALAETAFECGAPVEDFKNFILEEFASAYAHQMNNASEGTH